jgi:hypothetical protein
MNPKATHSSEAIGAARTSLELHVPKAWTMVEMPAMMLQQREEFVGDEN